MSDFKQGDSLPELRVTPDAGLTKRYAEASGDPNPIHTDPEFAKSVGLPGVILHGLYSMAQVARAHTEAAGGDPRALKRLSVQFRGMGFPEQEIVVTATVKEASDGRVVTDTVAAQGDNQIIRNAEAELSRRASGGSRPERRTGGRSPAGPARPRRSTAGTTARGSPRGSLLEFVAHALRAPAADPQAGRRRLPRVRASRWARRAIAERADVEWSAVDRARRARGARAGRLPDPPAHLGGPGADRRRLSLLRRLAARLRARGCQAPRRTRPRSRRRCAARWTRRCARRPPSCRGSPTCSPLATAPPAEHGAHPPGRGAAAAAAGGDGRRDRLERRRSRSASSPSSEPVDPGLVEWASSYLNERLAGLGLGARMIADRLADPELGAAETAFLAEIARRVHRARGARRGGPLRRGRRAAALRGARRRPAARRRADARARAPRRPAAASLRSALDERSVFVWIGDENPAPELRSVSVVGANYGLGYRNLGTVGVVGPLRMDYATAIASVRDAAGRALALLRDGLRGLERR